MGNCISAYNNALSLQNKCLQNHRDDEGVYYNRKYEFGVVGRRDCGKKIGS